MKAQIKGFIVWSKEVWDEGNYSFIGCEMPEHGYTTVMPYTLEVDIPESFDPVSSQVDALKKKKTQAMADYQALVTSIDRQISELTALEYTA